ncbi:DUF4339 domain-containing protein [Adhaeretor mobilis]|nr:DUF4339 domain-containing protein [Adhaeretor mobilis]
MGIRFACPNGHKLNVKAELAGRRAICPQCKAKIVVPQVEETMKSQASRPSEELAKPAAKTASKTASKTAPEPAAEPSATPAPPLTPSPPPLEPVVAPEPATEEVIWYVRSTTGEQFGPASTDVMRGWIDEGRVAADSWTWRTGWEDWKPGADAIAELSATKPASPPVEAVPAMVAAAGAVAPVIQETASEVASQQASSSDGSTNSAAEARRLKREKKKKRNKIITIALGVLTLALAGLLAWVLLGNKSTEKKPTEKPVVVAPVEEMPVPEETTQNDDAAKPQAAEESPPAT